MSPSEHTFNSILPQKQLNLYLWGQKYAIEWLFLNNCLYLYQQIIDQSLVQNADRLCFAPNAPLRIEFEELYTALFKHADQYISMVKTLSQHKVRYDPERFDESPENRGAQSHCSTS